jgi:hypothetical protein
LNQTPGSRSLGGGASIIVNINAGTFVRQNDLGPMIRSLFQTELRKGNGIRLADGTILR